MPLPSPDTAHAKRESHAAPKLLFFILGIPLVRLAKAAGERFPPAPSLQQPGARHSGRRGEGAQSYKRVASFKGCDTAALSSPGADASDGALTPLKYLHKKREGLDVTAVSPVWNTWESIRAENRTCVSPAPASEPKAAGKQPLSGQKRPIHRE
jgi:hypothetical protein